VGQFEAAHGTAVNGAATRQILHRAQRDRTRARGTTPPHHSRGF
jgi:hypothetical protein